MEYREASPRPHIFREYSFSCESRRLVPSAVHPLPAEIAAQQRHLHCILALRDGMWQCEYAEVRRIRTHGGNIMIVAAVICTLLGGVLGAYLEPVSLAISIPIAIMGGFILKAVRDSKRS